MKNLIKILAAISCLLIANISIALQIAITVDDLPANGDLPINTTRAEILNTMLASFKKHHITSVYGFMNGEKLEKMPDEKFILQKWLRAGHFLANHSYHHLDLSKTDSLTYIADIQKNELVLSAFNQKNDYHYYRYPFLAEGETQEKRDDIRRFLFTSNYKISPVTVDFFEYEWNDAYVRCSNKHDDKSIAWLKTTYLDQANNALIIAHELSIMLFQRDIKNILLIHINAFTASMLDELLTNYEKNNVEFVSLPDALNDDVYQINPNIIRDRAYTFLNQVRIQKNLPNPAIVQKLYDSLPEEQLEKICR